MWPSSSASPGDLVIADDDGVVVVPRLLAETVLKQCKARGKGRHDPARLKAGELGLDINGIRDKLRQKGLVYQHYESEA